MEIIIPVLILITLAWLSCIFSGTATVQHDCHVAKRVMRVFKGDRCILCGEVSK